jgi:hypothetical protein
MANFLTSVAHAFFQAVLPVARPFGRVVALRDFLRSVGWTVDTFDDTNIASVKQAAGVTALLVQSDNILDQLEAGGDEISLAGQLVEVLGQLLDAARAPGKANPTLPYPVAIEQFWSDLATAIVDENVARYLELNQPILYATARATGLIDLNVPTDFDPGRAIVETRRLRLDRLGTIAGGPATIVRDVYNWNNPALPFDHQRFVYALRDILWGADVLARVRNPVPALLSRYYDPTNTSATEIQQLFVDLVSLGSVDSPGYATFGLSLLPIPAVTKLGPPVGWALLPVVAGTLPNTPALPGDAVIDFGGGFAVDGGVFFEVRPDAVSLSGGVPGAFVGVTFKPETPWVLVGTNTGSRLELSQFQASLGIRPGSSTDIELSVGAGDGVNQGQFAIVIDLGQADGFVAGSVGSSPVRTEFPLTLKWSSNGGFALNTQIGLAVNIPVNRSFAGTLFIRSIGAALRASGNGASIEATLDGTVKLGPVSATISGIGVEVDVSSDPPPGGRHNFVDLSTSFDFKSPTGVGIDIDAGPVSGGGFIGFEPDIGRYSGAVELSIYGVALKAFGVIETKVPGVAFSFVIVISAEFPNPIQLGFGFTLNGVGGLVGIHRTVDAVALQALVTAGTASNLLFPKDVIGNAPAIIRDLTSVFPAREGRYLFGPIARLGWGTPTLIRGDLGLILEIPGPVLTILGEIRALLPKPEAALVKFNLSVGGRLDFPNKSFSLDAVLHDSVINGYPVSGQMAMRLRWGDNPSFALAIGGFHPAFQPPSNFPKALQPLTVVLAQQGSTSATVSGFFAITPNTLQVGGEARLHASGSGISLDASVSVKAIFVFSPFSFNANIDASVKISFRGYGPSVHLRGVLSGPSPWRVKGEVCVSILFWDACLGFDQEFGGRAQVAQAEINPWLGSAETIGLKAALEDPKNWATVQPAGSYAVVSLAPGADSLVDPGGSFSVRQKVVPVETDSAIARLGTAKAKEPGRTTPIFYRDMQPALVGVAQGALSTLDKVLDFFAPAQFFEMNEAKKLSAPSFEKKQAGYVLAGNTGSTEVGSVAFKEMKYDTVILGTGGGTSPAAEYELPDAQLSASSLRNAVASRGFGRAGVNRFLSPTATQPFAIQDVGFVITRARDLARLNPNAAPLSRTDALIALDAHIALHPEQAGLVQIVALHELQAA